MVVSRQITPTPSSRMLALDLLRGFFIVVIIVDHLWRWPNLFGYISGEGQLWVTAGEGFVIISGLLVGYIRGFKNRKLPFREVVLKVELRALLLYAWLVGLTIFYTALTWYITFAAPTTWVEMPKGEWGELIRATLQFDYQHTWIHFLYFYAALLTVTPIAIYLFRKGFAWAVALLSMVGYFYGVHNDIEWMQWIPMFFLPAIAGFYLERIQLLWQHLSRTTRTSLRTALYALVAFTVVYSALAVFVFPSDHLAASLNAAITKEDHFPLARIPIALLWFVAFALFFNHYRAVINRLFGWLLMPFGLRSLTAYILHGSLLFLIAYYLPLSENIWYNTFVGILAIIATWLLINQRLIQKIIPR